MRRTIPSLVLQAFLATPALAAEVPASTLVNLRVK